MYTTSAAYKSAVTQPGQQYRIRGTVGDVPFTDENIIRGSVEFSNQASDSTDVVLGARYIGELSMVFTRSLNIPRGTWIGKVVKIYIGLKLPGERWEEIPMTPYTITEAQWSMDGISINAVDNMAKFDKAATFNTTSGALFDIASYLCSSCGVTFGMTAQQCAALPNGGEVIGLDPEAQSSLKTYRDILSWLAQTCGCFATINRDGELVLKTFTGTASGSIPAATRYYGGSYSDFETNYTGINVVNIADETTSYYSNIPDDGLTMNLGSNPFLQLGLPGTVRRQRRAVLDEVANIHYTPFDITIVPDPSIDLGDHLNFPDGIGQGVVGCVMSYVLKYNDSLALEGFGQNPSLATAQSKNDKVISGILQDQKTQVLRYFLFENAEQIDIGNSPTTIGQIAFGNSSETDVDIWHEFKLDTTVTDGSTRFYAYYYLDGELQNYQPIDTVSENGYHILGLNYHITGLQANSRHTWRVDLKAEGGTAVLDAGDAHITLSGLSLGASSEWNGIIEASDRIPRCILTGMDTAEIAESLQLTQQVPIGPHGSAQVSDIIQDTNPNSIQLVNIIAEGILTVTSPEWFVFAGEGLYTGDKITTGLI